MAGRKTIAVDEALHALWTAEAKAKGQSLTAYVQGAVEAVRTGEVVPYRPAGSRVRADGSPRAAVRPQDCTNRVAPGTFCKVCGSIHGRKA